MLPEVQRYFEYQSSDAHRQALREIERNYRQPSWREDFTAEERAAFYKAETDRSMAMLKARHESMEVEAQALEGLRNSSNPLVAWIATNPEVFIEYRSYSEVILRELPMTREELENYREKRPDWCDTYDMLLEKAALAGVLPDPEPELADTEALTQDILTTAREYRLRKSIVQRIIRKHLPGILADAKRRAEEKEGPDAA